MEALEQGGWLRKGRDGCGVHMGGSMVGFIGRGVTGEGRSLAHGGAAAVAREADGHVSRDLHRHVA